MVSGENRVNNFIDNITPIRRSFQGLLQQYFARVNQWLGTDKNRCYIFGIKMCKKCIDNITWPRGLLAFDSFLSFYVCFREVLWWTIQYFSCELLGNKLPSSSQIASKGFVCTVTLRAMCDIALFFDGFAPKPLRINKKKRSHNSFFFLVTLIFIFLIQFRLFD